jgi:lipopolysaccharide export system permease protein
MTMPFATLLAMLYCLGNMSRNNEIIAMRASGIPLFRIIRSYLIMGVAMYLFTLWLNEQFVPQARRLASQIMFKPAGVNMAFAARSSSDVLGYSNVQENRQWTAHNLDLVSNTMRNVTVTHLSRSADQHKLRSIVADRAEYVDGYGWFFYDVKFIRYAADGSPTLVQRVPKFTNASYKETPKDIASAQQPESDMMTFGEISRQMRSIDKKSDAYLKLRMERHKRIAMPAICIVFVLQAAPFGIFHTRAGMIKGVTISIGLCLVYYFVAAAFIGLGQKEMMPMVLAAWLPNIGFSLLGVHLLYRMR